MDEKRKKGFWKIKYTLPVINISLIYVAMLILINFYVSWKIAKELLSSLQFSGAWWINFLVSELCFLGVIFILLITLLVILHRSLGPLPRIEEILDKVIDGDYSLRVGVRKKDIMQSLAVRLNRVLDLLEKKAKG